MINNVVLAGSSAEQYEEGIPSALVGIQNCSVTIVNTWRNALNLELYTPPVSKFDSLDYVVVAGLALDQ